MPSVAHSLTFAQSEAIQYVQKRAMRITHCNSEYSTLLAMSNLQYLYQQREELTQWFLCCYCLYYLLPPKQDCNFCLNSGEQIPTH